MLLNITKFVPITQNTRNISLSSVTYCVTKLTRLNVVDNSEIGKQAKADGKPPRCIHVYSKKGCGRGHGTLGDKILVAIKGQKLKAVIVGVKQTQYPLIPKFDSNNIVLIDEAGCPLGTRITAPIPSFLRNRKTDYNKLIAIATTFV